MSQEPPTPNEHEMNDDEVNTAFTQHPGIRTLGGPDIDYMAKPAVARMELFNQTRGLSTEEIPLDSSLSLTDNEGNTTTFYRTSEGKFELVEIVDGEEHKTPWS